MRALALVPIVLLGAGAALVVASVLGGGATVSLVVIVPVVSGRSVEFLLGFAALGAGFLCLPLLFGAGPEEAAAMPSATAPSPTPSAGTSSAGGLVLVGPVPIFFGSWRNVSARTRWWVALAGAAILVVFLVLFAYALR